MTATTQPVVFGKVTRTFGRTVALDRLDLAVEPGTVLGLVGRNGARQRSCDSPREAGKHQQC